MLTYHCSSHSCVPTWFPKFDVYKFFFQVFNPEYCKLLHPRVFSFIFQNKARLLLPYIIYCIFSLLLNSLALVSVSAVFKSEINSKAFDNSLDSYFRHMYPSVKEKEIEKGKSEIKNLLISYIPLIQVIVFIVLGRYLLSI